jgi:hypothetical protein
VVEVLILTVGTTLIKENKTKIKTSFFLYLKCLFKIRLYNNNNEKKKRKTKTFPLNITTIYREFDALASVWSRSCI